ncbi:CDP-alcohol phosphatidyltransferase family protein [Oceanirhabdus sp. W0125-5]|uniref:CDP-alcohol phosphatidyltransferase family protein n=1 Tax=Oceanirhabdus sp. W0125-5 TaxID=2999116 RepID=UPI0022F2B808|nr:CDP-alcohol phosphatidyltransferase family protein [Oceanirhabdus sp. W0125-5]WBW97371.1 CDP-alcohol phosphatidyltransferase family protein [Oceanirhabdus sp. W0125-5]
MLDTHGRKYAREVIVKGAELFIKLGVEANGVTKLAFAVGISSGVALFFNLRILAVLLLWFSGYLDAVDGEIARKTNTTSDYGALMDIVFDRMVEGSIIAAIAVNYQESRVYLVFLSLSIILSMTIFLTVGALSEKRGVKSFYYQAGLAERTEGFIMFTLMILFINSVEIITIIFTGMILFTALQRMREGKRILQ